MRRQKTRMALCHDGGLDDLLLLGFIILTSSRSQLIAALCSNFVDPPAIGERPRDPKSLARKPPRAPPDPSCYRSILPTYEGLRSPRASVLCPMCLVLRHLGIPAVPAISVGIRRRVRTLVVGPGGRFHPSEIIPWVRAQIFH